jgi:hypothetical protein
MDVRELAENIADRLWSASDKQASLSAVESLLAEAMLSEYRRGEQTHLATCSERFNEGLECAAQVAEEHKRLCAYAEVPVCWGQIAAAIRKPGKGGE